MTTNDSFAILPDQTRNITNTSLSFEVNEIVVSQKDIDSEPIPQKGLFAVLPAYNDELVIGSLVVLTKKYVERVIVIDDGSSDRTGDIAKIAGAEVFRLEQSSGKTYAILLGLKHARETGCIAAIMLDADGHHDPKDIQSVAGFILAGKADLVIGSRFFENTGKFPLKQKIKQMMLQLPDDTPQHLIPTDPLSGFMAFSRKALDNLDFPFEKTRFHQNLIKYFFTKNLLIKEVEISQHPVAVPKYGWDYSATIIAALPAYNEEMFLSKIIPVLKSYVDLVVIVDDGSTDATTIISQQLGAYVVKHPENRGYGAALQTIFSTARDLNIDALVIMDSDGQHDPEDTEKVLEPLLHGADVVIGSRYLDKTKNNIPQYRKIGMKVLDTATAVAGVKNVTDTQSGFRAYGKKAINIIDFSGNGMSAGSEILIQISKKNLTVVEVPINVRYDMKNTSSQNPVSHGLSVLGKIIALISYQRPLPVFGIPGVILVLIGLGAAFITFSEYYMTTQFPFFWSMVSAVCLIIGMLLGVAGLILYAMIKENRE